MISKINFKLEILLFYFRKNLPFFVVGLAIGIASFVFRQKLFSLLDRPSFHPQKIGIEGLYTPEKLPQEVAQLVSYGLTQSSDNQRPSISPLTKSIELLQNNLEYKLSLNDNLFWHNGKKFTTNDINYQISGLSFKIISPSQLIISTEKPFAPLLSLLTQPLLYKNIIGLGPYKIKNISYRDGFIRHLDLKPLQSDKKPITFRFYPNDQELITAFKMGAVDQIQLSSLPQNLLQWPNIKITQTINSNQRYIAIFLNTEKFSDKKTRQALAYGTPKTKDQNERCLGPISPSSWAYNPDVKDYYFNPARAKELWETGEIKKINLSVNNRNLLVVAEEIKSAWQSIFGLEVIITIENRIDTQNFEAALAYGGIPNDPDQYAFWHSSQEKTNLTKINYPPIDKLLENGRQTIDLVERKKIYQNFQKLLLEESPVVFLSYPTVYTVNRIK